MNNKDIINKIFARSDNPVESVESLANLCPFIFGTAEARESFNSALKPYGYKINDEAFQETEQIIMMSHSSCGSSNDNGYGWGGGHPSCGTSSSNNRGGGHSSCCTSANKPYSKILLPINDIGQENGIRN